MRKKQVKDIIQSFITLTDVLEEADDPTLDCGACPDLSLQYATTLSMIETSDRDECDTDRFQTAANQACTFLAESDLSSPTYCNASTQMATQAFIHDALYVSDVLLQCAKAHSEQACSEVVIGGGDANGVPIA